ncbi:non-ribosomal peptide synthetase [Methylosinus sp. Sm6]|uniref:non-ribosomal peptide synthetase n=1 Tax=Methylosinus sp. Sm6 TaxID=2866948 RepID=UPI001C990264|nr:non-ribosomal peptide synthetase [Methylosinus sp. Sm6]MBY6243523.1 amino acid adenylation domain-containing protein [Methylosinus sp. Sm6]
MTLLAEADERSCEASTDLVTLLRLRAASQPDDTAYIFLEDGERETARLTFLQLDRRAKAIAAQLQSEGLEGQRALLLYPPGLDYIQAFFGCLYAGVIGVPAYPPSGRHLERLQSIFVDAAPATVMTIAPLRERIGAEAEEKLGASGCRWTLSDCVGPCEGEWRPIAVEPDQVAFLQYTSGSTSSPRGVMVSHRNLIANQSLIKERFGHDRRSTLVGWLPLYHDMGLIGNILQPLYVGATAILMSPMAFLEKPVRWLQAISLYRAHTSGGPNFAFDLCVRKITREEKATLDLASWAIAFSGAEPVRAATLDRFAAAFSECGFRRESFFPCYGLAEATLVVTAPCFGEALSMRHAARGERDKGEGLDLRTGVDASIVGCGRAWQGHEVAIVDPQTMRRRVDGEVGEIWVRGPSVASGYWRRDGATEQAFRARIAGEGAHVFLRTGDLGFLEDDALYVTGRLKDLVIIGGRNFYPQDFEYVAEEMDEIRPGCAAAFSVTIREQEGFVMALEPRRSILNALRDDNCARALLRSARDRLASECEVSPVEIVLVKSGSIPKTSSGKIRRGECRRLYLENALQIIAREKSEDADSNSKELEASDRGKDALLRDAVALLPKTQKAALITRFLTSTAAKLLNVSEGALSGDISLRRSGLDSLRLVELAHAVASLVDADVPLSLLFSDVSFAEAAEAIADLTPAQADAAHAQERGLSETERAIWAVHQLDPSSVAYNLHLTVRMSGEVDREKLRLAFRDILERHAMLRSAYRMDGEQIVRSVLELAEVEDNFHFVEALDWAETQLHDDITARIFEPFALQLGVAPRATLYRRSEGSILLLCAHHISIDLWSLILLLEELREAYAARRSGTGSLVAPPRAADYHAFVSSQKTYLQSPVADADWAYWRGRLGDELPILALPLDHPRPVEADYLGASVHSHLDAGLTQKLDKLAQANGTTLFALLLAAYKVLLYRYTNQSDIIVGTASSGRHRAQFSRVIGNFVNPLALRSRVAPRMRFVDYLREVQTVVSEALTHQEFPFSQLVERLQPERRAGQWPVFQTWFALQQAQSGADRAYAQLPLCGDSETVTWDDLTISGLAVATHIERFDLKLVAARTESSLACAFQYHRALFNHATIVGLAEQFEALLDAIVADPNARIGCLPLRGAAGASEATPRHVHGPLIHELVSAWAEKDREVLAVVGADGSYTYGRLEHEANRLANFLVENGVERDAPIGLCVERSAATIVTIIAILKAGSAYLPIDPELPPQRIAAMLGSAGARRLLCRKEWFERSRLDGVEPILLESHATQIAAQSSVAPTIRACAGDLAYVIFTSGSSGSPKGVAVTHGGLVNYTRAILATLGNESGRHFALASTLAADLGHTSVFPSLASGGCLHVLSAEQATNPQCFADYLTQHPIDVLKIVPSHYRALLPTLQNGAPLPRKALIFGGERLPLSLVKRLETADAGCAIFNHYGPTETTVGAMVLPLTASVAASVAEDNVPIGRPIDNTRVYVLGADLAATPQGAIGEICVAGAGLARGYIGRPDLTAERFLPDPYSAAGDRLYRTGDLGRIAADGAVTFLGRIDQQLKIRGFRVELGEIESRLLECDGVAQAVVAPFEEASGQIRLAAYLVMEGSHEVPTDALRARLSCSLPSYMIPAAFSILDVLPVTANGKIDRRRLPKPDASSPLHDAYVAPRNETERILADVYQDVLAIDRIGVEDNFFALGGDSIMSIQASSRARGLGLVLSPSQIFRHQTIAALAPTLATRSGVDARIAQDRAVVRVDEQTQAGGFDIEDAYALTPLQEGLLFHTLSEPGSGVYVMQHRYWIEGVVDVEQFRRAWQAIADAHPIFRTSFDWEGTPAPRQVVHHSLELPFAYVDWMELEEGEQTRRLDLLLAKERSEGFDLRKAPLVRIRLFRLRSKRYLLIRSHHHILFDAWCTSSILQELRSNYQSLIEGGGAPPRERHGFRAYVDWLSRQNMGAAEEFWRRNLEGFGEPTPFFGRRSPTSGDHGTKVVEDVVTHLSHDDTTRLDQVARDLHVTPNTFVQAALALLLARYTRRAEVAYGITVSGRPADLAHVEQILGLFINGLPLRVVIDPSERLSSLLSRILEQNYAIRDHEYVSLTQVQEWSEVPRGNELFQYLLTYENAPVDSSLLESRAGWRFTDSWHRTHTNYPVTFVVIPGPRLHLQITYANDRLDPAAARRLLDDYRRLLEMTIRSPNARLGEFAALGADERRLVAETWNETNHSYAEPCDIIGRFERQASERPKDIAARCGGRSITYSDLALRVDRIACGLIEHGVEPDEAIALLDERGIDFLAAMLGIFKAGCGYLPLDPAYPDSRIAQVLQEARVRWLVAGSAVRERTQALLVECGGVAPRVVGYSDIAAERHCGADLARRYGPRSLAFVIYTSGSTGKPKGAAVERRGMFNNLITKERALDLAPADVIAQTASQCFDISVWQFLTALAIGARVEIFPDEISRDPARLLREIEARGVTILEAVPSMIQALLDAVESGRELDSLRWLLPCGEAFTPELCRRFMARFPRVRLLNAYGPAECSDDVSYHPIEAPPEGDELSVPIGRPVDNTKLYVVDPWLNLAPIGAAGEICATGVQVGRGYLGRPDLTAAAFLPDPFGGDGGRLYRTGDLGRWRSDGVLEFLGRVDHQIKIRGNRIEPGEIQACLMTHTAVREAYVMPREVSKGVYRLVAYVVGSVVDAGELREHVVQRLPEFMAPAAFVFLESLPLTPNGKVDRKRLPDGEADRLLARRHTAPRNATEELLCDIWAEVLRVKVVGVEDNFFELGGHSLLAIQIRSRIRQAFDVELPLRSIFEATTVATLAERVEDAILEALESVTEEEAAAALQRQTAEQHLRI